jgi:tRNA nucleotidyltransferase (CCA-adding enzyme)
MTITFDMPEKVETIVNTLTDAGFDTFVVGGCVRDILMGVAPHDWDICTSATPDEVKMFFEHIVPTGEKHGTVTIMLDGEGFEVTTFRIDGDSSDGRHPDSVLFTRSLRKDLMRRDFTMNAIAFNRKEGLVDLFGGQEDIENGIIRCVGSPRERFEEDALRMMRAVRFSAQKDFVIEHNTFATIIDSAHKIENVSFERIRDEVVKTITSDHPERFGTFHHTGLLAHFAPELDKMFGCKQNNPHHVFDVAGHTLFAMSRIENTVAFRLAMLFHDAGKPVTKSTIDGVDHFFGHEEESVLIAENVMARLKFDNETINKTVKLVRFHMAQVAPTKVSVRRWINRIGSIEEFLDVMTVKVADAGAQKVSDFVEIFDEISECVWLALEIQKDGEAFSVKSLAINGHDLIAIGIPQDKRMSEMLNKLVDIVIEHPEFNTKEKLIEIAEDIWLN